MDYCSHTLSPSEYSSRTPRSSGSEKVLSSAHFYGPLLGKEFCLRVNIHPALFAAVVSCRVEAQIQGWVRAGCSRPSFTARRHPCQHFLGMHTGTYERGPRWFIHNFLKNRTKNSKNMVGEKITVNTAVYKDVFKDAVEIGTPDHSFIVASIKCA